VLDSIAGFTNDADRAVEIVQSFKDYATRLRMPFIVINHVTKDGDMAGQMKLQHAGDISLMLTKSEKGVGETVRLAGDDDDDDDEDSWFDITEVRELYTEKSRYGPSGISTYYAMTATGLRQVEREEDLEDEEDEEEDA
jgi:predicted ATP-dependent serine protease